MGFSASTVDTPTVNIKKKLAKRKNKSQKIQKNVLEDESGVEEADGRHTKAVKAKNKFNTRSLAKKIRNAMGTLRIVR